MTHFVLRLRPPHSSISYESELIVYKDAPGTKHEIGIAKINHDSESMLGEFSLSVDVESSDYVYYLADITTELPHLYAIIISKENVRANTIANSLVRNNS